MQSIQTKSQLKITDAQAVNAQLFEQLNDLHFQLSRAKARNSELETLLQPIKKGKTAFTSASQAISEAEPHFANAHNGYNGHNSHHASAAAAVTVTPIISSYRSPAAAATPTPAEDDEDYDALVLLTKSGVIPAIPAEGSSMADAPTITTFDQLQPPPKPTAPAILFSPIANASAAAGAIASASGNHLLPKSGAKNLFEEAILTPAAQSSNAKADAEAADAAYAAALELAQLRETENANNHAYHHYDNNAYNHNAAFNYN